MITVLGAQNNSFVKISFKKALAFCGQRLCKKKETTNPCFHFAINKLATCPFFQFFVQNLIRRLARFAVVLDILNAFGNNFCESLDTIFIAIGINFTHKILWCRTINQLQTPSGSSQVVVMET